MSYHESALNSHVTVGRSDLVALLVAAVLGVAACSGGGGSSMPPPGGGSGSRWTPGVFMPHATFAAQCDAPRTGTDATGQAFPDVEGTAVDENNWLRSWSNDLYLWYDEIVDRDPAAYATPDYFDLLKTTALTASGNPKDRFHFTVPTDEWQQFSQSGQSGGYGARFVILSAAPPRELVIAFTEPSTPATMPPASLARGARVLTIDGVDVVNANDAASIATLNEAIAPEPGDTHTFTVRDLGASMDRTFSMTATVVTADPVQHVTTIPTQTGPVGYMLFNDHIATSQAELIDAVEGFASQNVTDLVLDIRYNGGGFLAIASQLAYMIAGPGPTAGLPFETLEFNDKHPSTDPVTGQPIEPMPFLDESFPTGGAPGGVPLPTLDLPRVFVLTGPNTCSASESIMNSLRGVGVEVVQIGSGTCGKPYGFYPTDNCGTTYFSIQFQGVNAQGFGDYPDGFSPANTLGAAGERVPGCSIGDDFEHALGTEDEARLGAALAYREGQACPAASGAAGPGVATARASLGPVDGRLVRPPWQEIRLLTP